MTIEPSPEVEPSDQRRVLVVEDEASIRELVSLHLGLESLAVEEAADGGTALAVIRRSPFDLIILDVMLPEIDGLALCRAIRASMVNRDVPVLILTARSEEADKIVGLEAGADDYLTKPFGVGELMARVRALLRRSRATRPRQAAAPPTVIAAGPVSLDLARRQGRLGGQLVGLTPQEFDVLAALAAAPGVVFSREDLIRQVWKEGTHVTARSVDTVIKRVRQKLETDPSGRSLVLTVRGSGYTFSDTRPD
jgi:DNA-binding response OmpR family regulator